VLRIDILTLFPALFEPFLETAFVAVAREQGAAAIEAHDLRAWATDRHRSVDDEPYGGGPGMVMTPEPLVPAIEALAGPKGPDRSARVVYLSPQGDPLTQSRLAELAHEPALLLVCGRYEGVDQRVLDLAVDEEISIGDYVLSGGELPAMVLVEGLVRLLPGVLGNPDSLDRESFSGGDLLEGPHYTRPPVYRGLPVPEVLRSGHHAEIERWRRERALARTRERRPDLLDRTGVSTPDPAEVESE
jgi:tRNA (guanine37-N1)-methyltransferase